MSTLMTPSPPPTKKPPDKLGSDDIPPPPRPTIETSVANTAEIPQAPASPLIRPPFAPFFTLITDVSSQTTHHPLNVHYLFSDDDPSILTSTCLDLLAPPSTTSSLSNSRPNQGPQPSTTTSSSSTSKSPSSSTAIPTPARDRRNQGERENRILLLDLDASGQNITRAQSLSSSWQILSTALTPAPTWAESPSDPTSFPTVPSYMLKIAGTDGEGLSAGTGPTDSGLGRTGREKGRDGRDLAGSGMTEADFRALMGEFDERMKVLRTVVEAGEDGGEKAEREDDREVEGEDDGE